MKGLVAIVILCLCLPAAAQHTQHLSDTSYATDQRGFAIGADGQSWQLWQGHKSEVPAIFRTDLWEDVRWEVYDYDYQLATRAWRAGNLQMRGQQVRQTQQRQATAAEWQWSKPAAHHWTLVRVQTPSGSSGSGVYVQFDCDCHPETGMRGVLTAAHVVAYAGTAAVHWVDGKSSRGAVTYAKEYDQYGRDHRGDVAWIDVQRQDVTPVSVLPQIQDGPVEVAGYGGPTDKRRHFWASASPEQSGGLKCVSKATATNGDSGGPWYQADSSGQVGVVGINHGTGGYDAEFVHAGSSEWIIGTESVSVGPRVINRFLGRVVKTVFG